jgi:very-short-patch-repair endonuclease
MFKLKNLQTKNEVDFFERLKCVFPGYYIGTQVAMSAIIETDNFRERPQFNTYYLDYVICDKKGEKPLMIIELDDKTHYYSEKRKTQDKRKNGIIQSTGIPFIRYKAQISYDITGIANNTIPYLNGTKTPPTSASDELTRRATTLSIVVTLAFSNIPTTNLSSNSELQTIVTPLFSAIIDIA